MVDYRRSADKAEVRVVISIFNVLGTSLFSILIIIFFDNHNKLVAVDVLLR